MSQRTDYERRTKPYKGAESYQVEDAHIFFGRDRDAQQIVAKILSSRLFILHAASGAGKTSILNAQIIPELESRGWTPVRALPQDNPMRAIRYATVLGALPPPQSESEAIQRLIQNVEGISASSALETAVASIQKLTVKDTRRVDVTTAIPTDVPMWRGERGLSRPFFCRLLQGTVTIERYCEHIRALSRGIERRVSVDANISLANLIDLLSSSEMKSLYETLVGRIDIPTPDLLSFFQNLFNYWGYANHVRYGLVVIIDQFEELFTRFVDVGRLSLPKDGGRIDWRLRPQFLEELRRLYTHEIPQSKGAESDIFVPEGKTNTPLRIRFVLSMRDEFVTRLDELRASGEATVNSSFHLDFLGLKEAASAINEPAASYGYSYSAECFDEITRGLVREGRYIEPSHIQIICESLWSRFVVPAQGMASSALANGFQVTSEMLNELGGALGILSNYFDEFLERFSIVEQFNILEMLEPLITSRGTRNIVEKGQLTRLPFRSQKIMDDLLGEVELSRIIRVEPRLGGSFVEITHEFLIPSILTAIRQQLTTNVEASAFREAVRSLQRLHQLSFRHIKDAGLSRRDFERLHKGRNHLDWTEVTSEFMLRGALTHRANKIIIRYWALTFAKAAQDVPIYLLIDAISDPAWGDGLLSMAEVRAICEELDICTLGASAQRVILRSAVTLASPSDRGVLAEIVSQLGGCDEANHPRYRR